MEQLRFLLLIRHFLHDSNCCSSGSDIIESRYEYTGEQYPVSAGLDGCMDSSICCICNGERHAGDHQHSVDYAVAKRHNALPINVPQALMLSSLNSKSAGKKQHSRVNLIEDDRNALFAEFLVQAQLMTQIKLLILIQIIHKGW